MSKIDEIRSAMVAAMKAGEKEKKETLSMLLAALKNKQIDKRADLTEEEEIQVIMKEIKQTKETLEMTPADRTDIIEECNRRLTVLEAYAPKMMGEDEIKAIIEGVLSELGIENPTGKDKGNIMKHLMPKVKGKADGKLVNDLVSTYFKYFYHIGISISYREEKTCQPAGLFFSMEIFSCLSDLLHFNYLSEPDRLSAPDLYTVSESQSSSLQTLSGNLLFSIHPYAL